MPAKKPPSKKPPSKKPAAKKPAAKKPTAKKPAAKKPAAKISIKEEKNTDNTSNGTIAVEDEISKSFLDYAMSVIVSRALPDVKDGLKPVQRRILYSMYETGIRPTGPFRKCSKVVGDVMGNYHPHGNDAIYGTLVRLGQNFSTRYPLIEPQGNFGTPDDPPAAMRYTESRMSSLSSQLLDEFIVHSLYFGKILNNINNNDKNIYDLGTGGGIPGIPIALTNPNKLFTLVDISESRAFELQRLKNILNLENVEVLNESADAVLTDNNTYISRCFISSKDVLKNIKQLKNVTYIVSSNGENLNENKEKFHVKQEKFTINLTNIRHIDVINVK